MGWGRNRDWPSYQSRPKVVKLSNEEQDNILQKFQKGIDNSSVLSALQVKVKKSRSRFYFERIFDNQEIVIIGRTTPLEVKGTTLLLEVEYRKWKEIIAWRLHKDNSCY